jgi:hypothetical protein
VAAEVLPVVKQVGWAETVELVVEVAAQMGLTHPTAVAVSVVLSELEVQRDLVVLDSLVYQVALLMEDMGKLVVVSAEDLLAYLPVAVVVVDLCKVVVVVADPQELLPLQVMIKVAAAVALVAPI